MCSKKLIIRLTAIAFCLLASCAISADSVPRDALATVNGKTVDRYIRDAVIRQLKSNGQEVDEQQILAELINLELLAQKAERNGSGNLRFSGLSVAAVCRYSDVQSGSGAGW